MTWKDQLNGDSLSWLLNSDQPDIRYLVLRDLLDLPDTDAELRAARQAAHQSGHIAHILGKMQPEGYWVIPGAGYGKKYRSSIWAMILLAQLGADIREDERIALACNYMMANAYSPGGQFSHAGPPSGTIDCLQGNLTWSLMELGFDDPRMDKAYEWMARTITGDGMSSNKNRDAELRYYTHQCGPNFACGANNKLPCAWGAVKEMLAFSKLPLGKRTPMIQQAIQQGIDFLFSIDPATAEYPSAQIGKPSRDWWLFGFPVFYLTDLLQLVEALVDLGCGKAPGLENALALIRDKQDAEGRWALEYDYAGKTWGSFGKKGEPNPWVTLRALRVLKNADASNGH